MLQIIEYLYVYVARRAMLGNKVGHSVIVVVTVCKFEDRFFQFLAEPENRFADHVVCPLAFACKPRGIYAGKVYRCRIVYNHAHIVVLLQV